MIDQGLELLDPTDAWRRVCEGEVGRIAVTMGALPAIFPVNYRVIDGSIVFRTAPGSKLSAASANAIVAFEVDDFDRANRSGWSVLVVGPSEVVHDLAFARVALDGRLEPWADGHRANIVRIRPEIITGRRIVHDQV
jgi:uncharacterized protein